MYTVTLLGHTHHSEKIKKGEKYRKRKRHKDKKANRFKYKKREFNIIMSVHENKNKPIKDGGSTAGLPPCNKPKDQQSN